MLTANFAAGSTWRNSHRKSEGAAVLRIMNHRRGNIKARIENSKLNAALEAQTSVCDHRGPTQRLKSVPQFIRRTEQASPSTTWPRQWPAKPKGLEKRR